MLGKFMLQGWKNLDPVEHYVREHVDLYEHIADPGYLETKEIFERRYENPMDPLGRWYLQVIRQLFKENRLAKGDFVGLGRRLDLADVRCPTSLLAGAADDIITPEQVVGVARLLGTPAERIVEKTVPGGQIGLFLGSSKLEDHWPEIARWLARG